VRRPSWKGANVNRNRGRERKRVRLRWGGAHQGKGVDLKCNLEGAYPERKGSYLNMGGKNEAFYEKRRNGRGTDLKCTQKGGFPPPKGKKKLGTFCQGGEKKHPPKKNLHQRGEKAARYDRFRKWGKNNKWDPFRGGGGNH